MAYVQLGTKTSADTVAAADPNQLQLNIEALKGGTPATAPTTTLEALATLNAGKVIAPATNGDNEIPLFKGANSREIDSSGATIETTITDSDTKVPTSGAVVDYLQASGNVIQMIVSNPSVAVTQVGSDTWVEVLSSFRVSITPKKSTSTLIITCTFMFGNQNTSNIAHFKIYDITNSADVNLNAADGSRTPMHGAARQVDFDPNDVDVITLSTSVASASTTARTYGLYTKNESGTGNKTFFGGRDNAAALPVGRPIFTIMEIA